MRTPSAELTPRQLALRSSTNYDASRDCPKEDPQKGDCVVKEMERAKVTLADTSQSDEDRMRALKYLVHFLGDAHQPPHCADNDDRGGNDIHVRFLGQSTNLHKAWDSETISNTGASEATYVRRAKNWLRSHHPAFSQGFRRAQSGHSRGSREYPDHPEIPVPLSAPGVSRTPDLQVSKPEDGSRPAHL
jgi:S1/P1 nuclease